MAQTPIRTVRSFSAEEIARLRDSLPPPGGECDEKPYRGQTGSIIAGCEHILDFEANQNREWEKQRVVIGGLDAHLCKVCRCWWVDAQMRANLLTRRSGFSESIRDNQK